MEDENKPVKDEHNCIEDELRATEARYRTLFDNSPDYIFLTDTEGKVLDANIVLLNRLGLSLEELQKTDLMNFFVGQNLNELQEMISRLLEGHDIKGLEITVQDLNGNKLEIEMDSVPLLENGHVIKILNHARDITKRKKAEEALRESEERFRSAFDHASIGRAMADPTGKFIDVNTSFCQTIGYTGEEFLQKTWMEITHPEDLKESGEYVRQLMEGEKSSIRYIHRLIHKDGHFVWVDLNVVIIRNTDGQPLYMVGDIVDITESKQAEEALQESEEKFRYLVENSNEVIYSVDYKGIVTYISPRIQSLLGYTPDELIGQDFTKFMYVEDLEYSKERFQKNLSQSNPPGEYRVLTKSGDIRWVHASSKPILKVEQVTGVQGILSDITDRKRAEENIKASLHEKELLLKEIHHRVKNNLQVISSMLSLQSMHIMDDDLKAMFRESQGRVQTMAIVHEKMYQSTDLSKIGFADYIKDLTNELFASYGVDSSRITSEVNVEDIMLGVDVAIPCGLIVNELISNSLKHAFPNGEKGEITINLNKDDDNKFKLIVGDNGVGFPKGIDFKEMESLGLRLVNTLVDQLKGTIELENKDGTKFKIIFTGPEKLKGLRD